MKEKIKNLFRFEYIVLVVYFALTLFISLYHEKWVDEAQAWFIAKNLSVVGIWQQMHYELTSGLWYFLLHFAIYLGFGLNTETILKILVMLPSIFIIAKYSPFPKWQKILIIFSFYLAYEYPIAGRNYALNISLYIITFWIFIAKNRSNFWLSVFILLLANSGTIGIISSVIITLFLIIELIWQKKLNWKNSICIMISIVGIAIALIQIFPVLDPFEGSNIIKASRFHIMANAFLAGIYPWQLITDFNLLGVLAKIREFNYLNIAIASVVYLIFSLSIKNKKILAFWLAMSLAILSVFAFKKVGYLRHFGFVWTTMILVYWWELSKGVIKQNNYWMWPKKIIINSSLILLLIATINAYPSEIIYNFSSLKEIGDYLNSQNHDYVLASDSLYGTALSVYIDKDYFDLNAQDYRSFFIVNKQYRRSQAMPIDKKVFPKNSSDIYFLAISKEDFLIKNNWKLVFENSKQSIGYDYPKFYLYKKK